MANYGGLSGLLGGSLGFLNTATTANTGNYVIKMQQAHSMPYPLTDRKIVCQDYGSIFGPPGRKATNTEWLDKRIEEILYKL